jgi:PhnB protein
MKTRGPTPYLSCKSATDAIAFYERVFGAVVHERYPMPDGRIGHAELSIDGGVFMLADEYPEIHMEAPRGTWSVLVHLYVDDLSATVARAVAAGARIERESKEPAPGHTNVVDPFGHQWILSPRG